MSLQIQVTLKMKQQALEEISKGVNTLISNQILALVYHQ